MFSGNPLDLITYEIEEKIYIDGIFLASSVPDMNEDDTKR
jgi:hypothetical protein